MSGIKVEQLSEEEIQKRGIRKWPTWTSPVRRFDWSYDSVEECYILEVFSLLYFLHSSFMENFSCLTYFITYQAHVQSRALQRSIVALLPCANSFPSFSSCHFPLHVRAGSRDHRDGEGKHGVQEGRLRHFPGGLELHVGREGGREEAL